MRLFTLILTSSLLAAADPVAVRSDGSPAAAGEPIASGAVQTTFTLAAAPRSMFKLAAGSTASVSVDASGRAVVDLSDGAVEADIADRGPFPSILVRGAALEIRVTGTIFVVQRVRRDTDYVALLQGKVTVNLRQEVLAMLGRDVPAVDLIERQGIGAGPTGFDGVDALGSRPVLPASGMNASIRDQALIPDQQGSTWTGVGLESAAFVPEIGLSDQIGAQVTDQVIDQVIEQVRQQVTEQVIDQIVSPPLPPLAGPPPVP